MSARTAVVTQPVGRTALVVWSGLLNGDKGIGLQLADFPEKTIRFRGTFGSGGTIVFEGSNDTTDGNTDGTWITLTDPLGNGISKTAAAIAAVTEDPIWVRPRVTAGDGTTTLVAELVAVQNVK